MEIRGMKVIQGNPRRIEVAPSEKLELTYGDKLRITTSFDYRGSAQSISLYGAIGNRHAFPEPPPYYFDEIIHAEATCKLPESPTAFSKVTASVDIPITSDIAPKSDYDIYCKIKEYTEAGYPEVDDVITISGIPPTFELLEETIYPYAYVYDGDCEISTFTFKSDPFTPASWIAGRLATHLEDEVKKAGGRVMEMRVYVDKSPLLWTDWKIEVVVQPPATAAALGTSLGIVWWVAVIFVVLGIIAIVVLTWSIKTIVSLFTHKALSEEVKAAWSRETLIGAINDFEVKLERTPTPTEELEKKSDDELRTYCDELASAVAPGVEGAGLALALAAGAVLCVGGLALVGMAMGKPTEKEKK